jgi:5-methylcytosine-specific restriction endonuclease McrA
MTKLKKTKVHFRQELNRKETYLPNEVLDFLPNPEDYPKGWGLKKIKKDYNGDMMKMGSDRYYTFAKTLHCAHCDLVGSFFAKERHINKKNNLDNNEPYHFNLYAINEEGNEVLMTKDHIIPKAKGGANNIANYQTMCTICNGLKQDSDEPSKHL